MNRIIEKAGYVVKIILAYICIKFKKNKYLKREAWLIGSGDDLYENNTKVFFEYMTLNLHKEIYWVTSDVEEIAKKVERVYIVKRGSIKNYLLAFGAEVALYSHSDYDVAPGIYRIIKRDTILVNLNHGFDGIKIMDRDCYRRMVYDVVIAASSYEKEFKLEHYDIAENKIVVTGLARFDGFDPYIKVNSKRKMILLMPTWRDWYNKENIQNSGVVKYYLTLIAQLRSWCVQNKFELVVKLHPYIENLFSATNPFVGLSGVYYIDRSENLQDYIRCAQLLITDYSSLSWDFMYMDKPIIYYWFDYEEYNRRRGLYVGKEAFRYVAYNAESVVEHLESIANESNWSSADKNRYFDYFDKENCMRIYDEITKWKVSNKS